MCRHPSAKMDLEVNAAGKSETQHGLALSLDFWSTWSLSAHVQCHPCHDKGGRGDPSILSSVFCFFPFSPCHDYYLEMFTRDKDWLFVNRRLIVNSSTGAHLPLLSGNTNRGLVVNVQPGACLSLISPGGPVLLSTSSPVIHFDQSCHKAKKSLTR